MNDRPARRGDALSIGRLAERTGLTVSAIRFYEERGLIRSTRNGGGQRRFDRATLRRLSFVRIAQGLGFTLAEIGAQLDGLPGGRTPTTKDWERLSTRFAADIDERIAGLQRLRDQLARCIGCGCLSLASCRLYNPDDRAASLGDGPRYLLGDSADAPQPEAGRFDRLHRAVNMATIWHAGQDRKYSEVPYIVHPLRVMSLVREVSDDEDMLIAAVLHDVVEDTPVTLDTIRDEFGDRAADLVDWLTDVSAPADGNRTARKAIDAEHTARAPADAQTIKLADLIDNAASITRADPHFARVYMAEKERLLGVLTRGDARLHERASASLAAYQTDRLQEALRHG